MWVSRPSGAGQFRELMAERAATPVADAATTQSTQDARDEQNYTHALVIPRNQLAKDDFQFGFVFAPEPARAGRLVAVGTGTPFVNKVDQTGAMPTAFTQNAVNVIVRTFAMVAPDALRPDGVGIRLRSGVVAVVSYTGYGQELVIRKDGGATMSLPGGIATLFKMIDKEWLQGLRRREAGGGGEGAEGPSGTRQAAHTCTQTVDLSG